MGILKSAGVDGIGSGFNWSSIGTFAIVMFVIFVVAVIAGVVTYFYYSKKLNKTQFKHTIPIFQTINGKHTRIGIDKAKELFIPDSNISLFFLKGRKIYIARPTRAMGKNEYWYSISENGEWINFDLENNLDNNTLAKANYDHRDTRYAYTNLKEIIKKNYKDKSVTWWKEYSHVIAFIVVAFIFGGCCVLILSRVSNLIEQLVPIFDKMAEATKTMQQAVQASQNINSGVIQS